MRTLYIDCGMGAAGDMLSAALLELVPDPDRWIEKWNALGIPGVVFSKESISKCGISGTHITVKVVGEEESEEMHCDHHHDHDHFHDHHHDHHHEHEKHHTHHHSQLKDIENIICRLSVSERVKKDVMAVYQMIAEAESHVHQVPVTEIHFHEVGAMDAVADITAVCMLMEELAADQVIVSPIHVGSGQVKCAHGILPVPAPATAYLLRDVPIYNGSIKSELCTPTGAALLRYFADMFGSMPVMRTKNIGYGMGKKDFEVANCIRIFLGEGEDRKQTVTELSCNLDDMTAEEIAFAMEEMLSNGALDVYTTPIGMKKSRPGTMFHVLCQEQQKEKMIAFIFQHTSTIGIRETIHQRYTLDRQIKTIQTDLGEVAVKYASGYGINKKKPEYEDVAAIAREKQMSFSEVLKKISKKI